MAMKPAEKRVSTNSCTPYSQYILTVLFVAIESRVARIKARVAELTNNMEGTSVPLRNP